MRKFSLCGSAFKSDDLADLNALVWSYFDLKASVRIRPMALLGVSSFRNAASVGAISAGLLTV